MNAIQQVVQASIQKLFSIEADVDVVRTENTFGDYATNIAMKLSKQVGMNPKEVAEKICADLATVAFIRSASVAGPGFINMTISDELLAKSLHSAAQIQQSLQNKVIVAEYSDPNPFKVLHAGHLYTSIVGDAIANVLQAAGAEVHRVNFGGDVGRHVGQTMWAIVQELGGEYPEKLQDIPEDQRSPWMAAAYIKGTAAFEDDEQAKQEIIALNKRVYGLHTSKDTTSDFAKIYWTCRQWSYDYFDAFYARIGTHFEKYYPESSVADLGLETVKKQLAGGVFTESNGAVVFDGEAVGLHTRVFINSEGLPTYEAKDVGLILQKKKDYNFDTSFVITANEQEQYMTVVLKAIEQFAPELTAATKHVTHGIVKLAGGVKMSSRKGNILRAVDVLDVAAQANKESSGNDNDAVVLGAVKYAFLKQRLGGDIVYDPNESVSIHGNSGPYLQYAYARAASILRKTTQQPKPIESFTEREKLLALKVAEFPDVITAVLFEYMPHHICTYLYELTQEFNRFYENETVVGSEREGERITLLTHYTAVLKKGLELLGISAPEQM